MLQRADPALLKFLQEIYKQCLRGATVLKLWAKARVIFLPKMGVFNHCRAKDFRPISLTSFLLKTLERLLDGHIRTKIDIPRVCAGQHAYLNGRSVETALHGAVNSIEKAFSDGEFTLGIILDIEGAFNNIGTNTINGRITV